MKQKACDLEVDLLLVDTGVSKVVSFSLTLGRQIMLTRLSEIGDLHDGSGLSDITTPNGLVSNPIFEQVDYDLLTIGRTCSLSSS